MGHEVFLLALNDPYCEENSADQGFTRLSGLRPWVERCERARSLLARFAPDIISLQFVCYGFHPRGFVGGLARDLKKVFGVTPVQITFHELWIGAETGAGLKDRVIGGVQRRGVIRLLEELRPQLALTTNPAYLALLLALPLRFKLEIGERLPLFGAIPMPSENAAAARPDPATPGAAWAFGIFGSLHPIWPPEPLLGRLLATGRKISLTHAGNIGQGRQLWEKMQREYGDRIAFERLGELSVSEAAAFFARMDFGIAATPWEIIGKSASAAAMLEHGLPVVVNRDDVHYRGWHEEGYSPLLIKMGVDLAQRLEQSKRQTPRSIRAEVARQLVAGLDSGRRQGA